MKESIELPVIWIDGLQKYIDNLDKEIPEVDIKCWKARVAFESLKGYLESLNSMK